MYTILGKTITRDGKPVGAPHPTVKSAIAAMKELEAVAMKELEAAGGGKDNSKIAKKGDG